MLKKLGSNTMEIYSICKKDSILFNKGQDHLFGGRSLSSFLFNSRSRLVQEEYWLSMLDVRGELIEKSFIWCRFDFSFNR